MKKLFGKLAALLMALVMVLNAGVSISSVPVYAAHQAAEGFGTDWTHWSQFMFQETNYRNYGCRVVAYTKVLAEMGIVDPGSFTPENFRTWMINNGYIDDNTLWEQGTPGQSVVTYAQQAGHTVTRTSVDISSKSLSQKKQLINDYLNGGYYVVLMCSAHTNYVTRANHSGTEFWISDSFVNGSDWTYNHSYVSVSQYESETYTKSGKLNHQPLGNFTRLIAYQLDGSATQPVTPSISIYYDNLYTDWITETNAKIHGVIHNPDKVRINQVAVSITDATEGKLLTWQAENCGLTMAQFEQWYDITQDLGLTLVSGHTYTYGMAASYNGQWYEAVSGTFTTKFNDTIPPTISDVRITDQTTDGYTVTCTVTDNVGVTKVQFATWTSNQDSSGNDQDDITWQDVTLDGTTASLRIQTADHNNESGTYNTHIYAWDAAGNQAFAVAPSVTIDRNPKRIEFTGADAYNITETSATVGVTITYQGMTIREAGFYFWSDSQDKQKHAQQNGYISGQKTELDLAGLEPDTTYFYSWYVVDEDGDEHESDPFQVRTKQQSSGTSDSGSGKTEPSQPQKPTEQETTKNPFTDVSDSAFYHDAVLWAVQNDITSGTSATTFSPNANCTRGQMVQFLYKLSGSPRVTGSMPFTDVSASAFYYNAVIWAVQNGITSGTDSTTFDPNENCTRGQMVQFLYRLNQSPDVSGTVSFKDISSYGYYRRAVIWAVQNNITSGTGSGMFSPNAFCTRGQMVQFLYKMEQAN